MGFVYRYIDTKDNVIKYIGIVYGETRTLKDRIKEHKQYDYWAKEGNYRIEYITENIKTRTDAEYFEAHYISLYNTDKYYNKSKAGWGISSYLPNREQDWVVFDDLHTLSPLEDKQNAIEPSELEYYKTQCSKLVLENRNLREKCAYYDRGSDYKNGEIIFSIEEMASLFKYSNFEHVFSSSCEDRNSGKIYFTRIWNDSDGIYMVNDSLFDRYRDYLCEKDIAIKLTVYGNELRLYDSAQIGNLAEMLNPSFLLSYMPYKPDSYFIYIDMINDKIENLLNDGCDFKSCQITSLINRRNEVRSYIKKYRIHQKEDGDSHRTHKS